MMRRELLLIGLFVCLSTLTLIAQDANLSLESGARLQQQGDESDYSTFFELNGDWTHYLSRDQLLIAEGFLIVNPDPEADEEMLSGDLTSLLYTGRFPLIPRDGVVSVSAGRRGLSDFSGLILDAPLDGAGFEIIRPGLSLGINGAYSGLLLEEHSPLTRTPYEAGRDNPVFGPARMLVKADIASFEFAARQSVLATVIASLDTPEAQDEKRDAFDSLTMGIGFKGPLSTRFFYTAYLFGQFNRYYDTEERDIVLTEGNAAAGGLNLRYYAPELSGSRFEATLLYASGDDKHPLFSDSGGGSSRQFIPYTGSSLGLVYPLSFSNLLLGEFRYSLVPYRESFEPPRRGVRLEGAAALVYRPAEGAGTLAGLDAALNQDGYLGTELSFGADWQIYSDLSIGIEGGVFLPGDNFVSAGLFPEDELLAAVKVDGKIVF